VNRLLAPTILFFALLGLPALAKQDGNTAAGEKILAAVDHSLNQAKTLYLEYDIVNQEPGKSEGKQAQTIWVKGSKRLVAFIAPQALEGTKVLTLSPTEMYVYLPAFGKVRRVDTKAINNGFMGMVFSPNDFFVAQYSGDYAAEVHSEAGNEVTLFLTLKAGKPSPYAKIEMTVLKEGFLPTMLKFYDAKGVHLKTETRGRYVLKDGVNLPAELKMTDATKEGCWTTMVQKVLRVNEDISDDVFSKRNLDK